MGWGGTQTLMKGAGQGCLELEHCLLEIQLVATL